MTPRELLSRVQHLITVAGVDPDQEILVSADVHTAKITKVDWAWKDPVDEGDYAKLLNIEVKVD